MVSAFLDSEPVLDAVKGMEPLEQDRPEEVLDSKVPAPSPACIPSVIIQDAQELGQLKKVESGLEEPGLEEFNKGKALVGKHAHSELP